MGFVIHQNGNCCQKNIVCDDVKSTRNLLVLFIGLTSADYYQLCCVCSVMWDASQCYFIVKDNRYYKKNKNNDTL